MPGSSSVAILESTCLILLGVWAVRPALTRTLARMFPFVFTALIGGMVVWVSCVVLLAAYLPSALSPVTGLALLLAAGVAYRNRSAYGRTRGLAPGSLSLASSLDALIDREFYRKSAARYGTVFKMAQLHQPVVCIVGLERAQRLLRHHEDALGPSVQRFSSATPSGFLRYMSLATHGTYGPLFRQALSARVMGPAASAVAEAARRALLQAESQARRHSSRTVVPESCLERVVDEAFLLALFGVSAGSPPFDALTLAYAPLSKLGLSDRPTATALTALSELRQLLTARVAQWRASPAADVPICALSELVRLDPTMPDATCMDNLVLIYKVSTSNVVGLLRWVLFTLGRHPHWITRLRDELASSDVRESPTLVERVVMETLRLSQSEYLYRRLRDDVQFDGFILPKGWLVRICVWESHRDPANFTDPDRFDPDRFLEPEHPRSAYMPFGGDRHACNGVPLTDVICHAFLQELTRGYDWGIDGGDRLERDFRHWSHWRPGRHMRLRLEALSAGAVPTSATGLGRSTAAGA